MSLFFFEAWLFYLGHEAKVQPEGTTFIFEMKNWTKQDKGGGKKIH